jgi:uncharacterized protein DUF2567
VAEQPAEQRQDTPEQEPDQVPAYPGYGYPGFAPPRPRPRVVIKADLVPAISVLSLISLFGLAIGWLWSLLAPPQRQVIAADGKPANLVAESYHRFDDLVLFMLLGLGAGLVTGVAVWFLRERRGPVIMIAAVLGGLVGAWLAMQVGLSFAQSRFEVPAGLKVRDLIAQAPQLESVWAILAWPTTTALAYGVLSAWNGLDDLGRRLG